MRFLKESFKEEKEELHYDNLEINYQYNYYVDYWDAPQWDDRDIEIEWDLTVRKSEIFDVLYDLIIDELEEKGINTDNLSDNEIEKYFEDNYDRLLESNYQTVLDYFEDRAKDDAQEKYEE